MERKFQVGDKVTFVLNENGFNYITFQRRFENEIGVIDRYEEETEENYAAYMVRFGNGSEFWISPVDLKGVEVKETNYCPRCGNKLEKIISQGLLYSSQPQEMEKCKACGYC